jgi:tetrapyrrole methylase family protein/MazG family protein
MAGARVTVVGLGPAGPELVTSAAIDAMARIPTRFVRTWRHPSALLVGEATSFDDIYDRADTFEDVYAEIVEQLVTAAERHGEVLYAVPGSPRVLERTVDLLAADTRVETIVTPALSFLDLAWVRLGIDPLEEGVRLVDAHRFATRAAGQRGPLLVAHCHSRQVLSDVKLAFDIEPPESVVVLQRLGLPDERIEEVPWHELDRVEADHLTSLWLPTFAAPVAAELVRFHELVRTLRERCPWDREQTHQSLTRHLLEETYEALEAIEALDPSNDASYDHLVEELGDVLFQVFFHAVIGEQEGRFTLADVAQGVHDKLVHRHPHVFGQVVADTAEQVVANWESIKRAEKGRQSLMDGIPGNLPSLAYATKVARKAASVGFDWPDVHGALPKISEELDELMQVLDEPDRARDELGDLLFAVANVARHLDIDAEAALRASTAKFRGRFEVVEQLAGEAGRSLDSMDLESLDRLWNEAKRQLAGEFS